MDNSGREVMNGAGPTSYEETVEVLLRNSVRDTKAFQQHLRKIAHSGVKDSACAQALLDKHEAIFGRLA